MSEYKVLVLDSGMILCGWKVDKQLVKALLGELHKTKGDEFTR